MRLSVLLVIAVILSLGVAGCTEPSSTIVEDGDDGSTVELSVGDTLEIHLEANATTGYEWSIDEPLPSFLQLSESEYETDLPAGSPVAGSGGTAVFVLEATAEGEDTLSLTYARPWESGETADQWSVRVGVAP